MDKSGKQSRSPNADPDQCENRCHGAIDLIETSVSRLHCVKTRSDR